LHLNADLIVWVYTAQADVCEQMSMPPVLVFITVPIPLAYASLDLAEIHSELLDF